VDGVRQQLFARARFTQQQHRAARLRSTPRLALDLGRCGAGADEAGKGVFGAALSIPRHGQRAAALAGQLAPGIVQVALQQRKLADEGLQRGLGVVKQHDADGADHAVGLVAQRNAADHKGARLVGEQINQHRLARFQHTAHLGVGDDLFHRAAQELVQGRKAQVGQEALVALVHPHDAAGAIDQEHALADAGKQLEHGTRRQLQNALGIERQCGGVVGKRGHGCDGSVMLSRVWRGPPPAQRRPSLFKTSPTTIKRIAASAYYKSAGGCFGYQSCTACSMAWGSAERPPLARRSTTTGWPVPCAAEGNAAWSTRMQGLPVRRQWSCTRQ